MKRLFLVLVLILSSAGAAAQNPRQAPTPAAKPKPKPPQPRLLGGAVPQAEATALAPAPAAPTVRSGNETVTPSDVVGTAFCAIVSSGWNANRWYVTYIDTVQQPWPGPLIPDPGDASGLCYQTEKKFQFAAGTHTLELALVNHCEPGDQDTACQQCALANAGATCGDAISAKTPITVVSTVAPPTCTIATAPATATIATAGGTGTVAVSASDPSCTWNASADVAWLSVSPASGTGTGTVTYTVPATTGGARSGNVAVAGNKTFVSQTGAPCTFTLSPTNATVPPGGVTSSVSVTLTQGGGCPWSATSSQPWATIMSVTGQDTGSVSYSVLGNTEATQRSATLTIAGLPFTLTQGGTTTDVCAAGQPEAASISYLRLQPSNPRAGQPMNPQYQITSKSPVTNIIVRMNNNIVGQLGPGSTALNAAGGQWFTAPTKGSYTMALEVVNALNCHASTGNIGVTVR